MPGAFARLLAKLAEANVRFLVVGGVAVCLHGYVRATLDLDILVEATEANARRLLETLGDWGEGFARELDVTDFVPAALGSIRIREEELTLDVFTLMRARTRGEEWDYDQAVKDARVYLTTGGGKIAYLSADRLIALKTGTGRGKDAVDIENLEEIQRSGREPNPIVLAALEPAPAPPGAPGASDVEEDQWPLSPA